MPQAVDTTSSMTPPIIRDLVGAGRYAADRDADARFTLIALVLRVAGFEISQTWKASRQDFDQSQTASTDSPTDRVKAPRPTVPFSQTLL